MSNGIERILDEELGASAKAIKTDDIASHSKEELDAMTKDLDATLNQVSGTAKSAINSSKIGKVKFHNPLLDWSAEVVEIVQPYPTQVRDKLRRRDIPQMHKHNRKEDTVASIKIVKEKGIEYARSNFVFALLEYRSMKSDDKIIIEREQYWITSILSRYQPAATIR